MPVPTYLKNQKRRIESKYHQAAKRFESQYGLIHRKVTSRFHREPTKTEIIHSKIRNSLTQSTVSIERKIKSIRLRAVVSTTSNMQFPKFHPDIIDWIRGRFSGETIRIVIREGNIVEKFFVTPKGNRIRVKRSKLELRLRSIPTIKVKLRLRLRPIRLNYLTT
tara:strand:+ start:155 stop:646 length:492 start_codon:yes stop_codon:yes gene_type:complete